ncbi:MAG TPA: DUF427 domain-containing protein [Acidimicrobiales bacterium]|nr:DUF427 domain-containing protein [Acidimicrobiales bacterium]
MVQIESAWPRYPDYRIDLTVLPARARARHGNLVLAESSTCLLVEETDHVPRLYFPVDHVRFDLLAPTDHHTICPFKGQADYWSLTAVEPALENVVWAYATPFDEVAGLIGHVCFYDDRVTVEIVDEWPGRGADAATVNRFPRWGDASELVRILDVKPTGNGRFVSPSYPSVRNVVEGSHLLAQAITAASKTEPAQRVTSAFMTFPRAASFDQPIDLVVDVLRRGRTFSTLSVRAEQVGELRAPALMLLDSGAPDLFRVGPEMPKVSGPEDSEPYDYRVTGRDVRVVDGAYSPDPDRVGPPEIYAWVRFRDDPGPPYLHDALVAQPTGHWTIAAAMRPHPGFGEADAHINLSTAIMSISIAFHDRAPVTEWLLYANSALYAAGGLAQGDGRVFSEDGRLVASYTVQAMIRRFQRDPASMGLDDRNAM